MKEVLYAIPVNDAFNEDSECPICLMYDSLEQDSIQFTLGPSYMEDDVRKQTNQLGFCDKHVAMLYRHQNRLGLALMMHSHFDKVIGDVEKLQKNNGGKGGGFFAKKTTSNLAAHLDRLERSCYVCARIEPIFHRYLVTIFHLYRTDGDFKTKFQHSKGFCCKHYAALYEMAANELSGRQLEDFLTDINRLYIENVKRVNEDLSWFIDKFDYRNADAPWKNSKDAVPRAITKTNGASSCRDT